MSHATARRSGTAALLLAPAALSLAGCQAVPAAPARPRAADPHAAWVYTIIARIAAAWQRPAQLPAGVRCELHVSLGAGGQVTDVKTGACSAGAPVQESIVQAVWRASPLPADPQLFDPNLVVVFAP